MLQLLKAILSTVRPVKQRFSFGGIWLARKKICMSFFESLPLEINNGNLIGEIWGGVSRID